MKQSNVKKEAQMEKLKEFIARFSANASKSKHFTSRKKLLKKLRSMKLNLQIENILLLDEIWIVIMESKFLMSKT
ncbi:hypothetical protein [Mycoplasmopsis cynos]|uniref:hypothetical protein n=1 Tax=Mycoplasmopsis cynos TaxID=171284 RepID=UPI0024CD409F|nr:hypothetical protein [Mycoplasmopsis cynos]WAM08089.1 hypothetical protein ONA21_01970 [Mycoplasmopsis cynos]